MTERPILFSGPMVRALLDGSKTQTRRVVKGKAFDWLEAYEFTPEFVALPDNAMCPYGQPGDRLWVRETWMDLQGTGIEIVTGSRERYAYGADTPRGSYGDDQRKCYGLKWRPSIHMPRVASRITLEITSMRVERLQDINEADAAAEGLTFSAKARRSEDCMGIYELRMPDGKLHFNDNACDLFRTLWEQINGPDSWAANPWVWVVEFRRLP